MRRLTITGIMTAMVMALSLTSISTASAGDNRQMAGVLIGATAGGLLGSTLGRGDGQVVATAVGALLGAGVGYEMTKDYPNRHYQRPHRVVKYKKVYKDGYGYGHKKWHRNSRPHGRHHKRSVWICNGHGDQCRLVRKSRRDWDRS